nr:Ig E binding factor [Muridae]
DSFIPREEQRKIQQAFPVFEGAEGGRVHAPVEYLQIKEIAESVRKYGTNANFTLVQLDRLAGMALTPADWQTVVKAALPSMGKYMEWRALWHEAAQAQARANAAALTPEQRDWTFDLLTGQGAYSADQTNYHWGAYAQISSTAIRPGRRSRAGETTGQLTKIIQGPQESFSDFVARMTEAAERIFGESEQAAPLIEQLIYEQATKECRAVHSPKKEQRLTRLAQGLSRAWGKPRRLAQGLSRAWGKPRLLKTDNGPAYTSQKFQQFCRQMDVTHLTGLPYNPQGQGIVERAHRTLKAYLIKQKRGTFEETVPRAPRVSVSLALFTLNFLNIDAHGHTAAERHVQSQIGPMRWLNGKMSLIINGMARILS